MADNEDNIKYSPYDQKLFVQERIHGIITGLNEAMATPLRWDSEYNAYHYEIICNELRVLYINISSKCTSQEKKDIKQKINEAQTLVDEGHESWEDTIEEGKRKTFNRENWLKIRDILFEIWEDLEELMDAHKFNPSSNEGEDDEDD